MARKRAFAIIIGLGLIVAAGGSAYYCVSATETDAIPQTDVVTGRVVDESGAPIHFAHLILSDVTTEDGEVIGKTFSKPLNEVTTAKDGRFVLERVRPGRYSISLAYEWDPKFLARRGYGVASIKIGAETAADATFTKLPNVPLSDVEVVVFPLTRIAGQSLDAKGAPIANARMDAVVETATDNPSVWNRQTVQVETNTEGHYAFFVEKRGTMRVSAQWDGINARSRAFCVEKMGARIEDANLIVTDDS